MHPIILEIDQVKNVIGVAGEKLKKVIFYNLKEIS